MGMVAEGGRGGGWKSYSWWLCVPAAVWCTYVRRVRVLSSAGGGADGALGWCSLSAHTELEVWQGDLWCVLRVKVWS